ncbi:hypothetical protein DDJ68_13180 [Mycobacteroides abscessus]|nr:hypothetical protein DDJ68_13180 [Mycobacteroides abscessus]RIR93460.1 hypothetical protein D2E57_13460 [Mycobacteroides abscessus]
MRARASDGVRTASHERTWPWYWGCWRRCCRDPVLVMCADAAREAAVSELRWVWARLVTKYVEGMSADV